MQFCQIPFTILRRQELFFIGLLSMVTLINIYDVYQDYMDEDHNPVHVFFEGVVVLVSLLGIIFLLFEIHKRIQEIDALRHQLSRTNADLADLHQQNDKLRQASKQYSALIQEQMTQWDFTPSEKEVALFLLKGLSFEEIASIRQTKDKTVRQQATAIYRKSGLNGRHEFAAWFFEDFLS